MPEGSHGRKILETLYGGSKLAKYPVKGQTFFYPVQEPVELNAFQSEYVEMLQNRKNHPIGGFRFVRYITPNNSKAVAEDCLTEYDLPVLQKRIFTEWAEGKHRLGKVVYKQGYKIVNYLLNNQLVHPKSFAGEAAEVLKQRKQPQRISDRALLEVFLMMYRPNVIMVTADSFQSLLSYDVLKREEVTTVQVDEASQLPEYSFISLLTSFPDANFGLIGDVQQLPPYSEMGLEGKLKDYGIGNTMERAVNKDLFPQAMLREVYRCHPKSTDLLSDLFYGGRLISGISEHQRKSFMNGRPDFWRNSNFPVMIVNNQGKTQRIGTSCGNTDEKEIVQRLLGTLTSSYNGYQLKESDIGVISFYKGQTSVLIDALRASEVKCGTVDAFQGTEKEVIVLCCTNEQITEFMQLGNRLNVAMSRAKQVTIIVGNVDGLKKAKYWETIVERVEQHGCVMEADALPKVYMAPRSSRAPTAHFEPPQSHNANGHDDYPSLNSQISGMKVSNNPPWSQQSSSQGNPKDNWNQGNQKKSWDNNKQKENYYHGNQRQGNGYRGSNQNSNGSGHSYNRQGNQSQPANKDNWGFSTYNSGQQSNSQQNNGGQYRKQNGGYNGQQAGQCSQNSGSYRQGNSTQNCYNNWNEKPQQSRPRYNSAPKKPSKRSPSPEPMGTRKPYSFCEEEDICDH